ELFRLLAQVLLEDDALRPHDEGHDAAHTVLGGIGDEREAAGHLAVLHVAASAAGRGRSLRRQDAVVVAVVGPRAFTALDGRVALGGGVRHQRAQRAPVGIAGRLPVETVALAGLARALLRVRTRTAAGSILGGVLA